MCFSRKKYLELLMAEAENLTKKQRKALQFRGKIEKPAKEKAAKTEGDEEIKTESQESSKRAKTDEEIEQPEKKKRKTRRGKKGKGSNDNIGKPRFILFVGNLPYDIKEVELIAHFKAANPDRVRIRKDKGIAFLEFDSSHDDIQSKMDSALKLHHSVVRNRNINVELTVGGGGNSSTRLEKLKQKNEKMRDKKKKEDVKKESNKPTESSGKDMKGSGIHPSRLNRMK